jgi:ubiquinone/menaquinone biosynthesis C-methylase UbiE
MASKTAMDSTALLSHLKSRETEQADNAWLSTLGKRKIAELEFHDEDRDVSKNKKSETDTHARDTENRKYYTTTSMSKDWTVQWIKDHSVGKVVLDYACGNGANTFIAAESGAHIAIGLDISAVSIRNCRGIASSKELQNTCFIQGDCENTELPANSIDVVICSGMLHHLDLSYAFYELRRILKPGGVILAIEALNYNPIITMYRRLTPHLRTDFEKDHILDLSDVKFASRFFEVQNTKYWHLLSIGTVLVRKTPFFGAALLIANALDKVLLRIPVLRLMAWMFTFELVKRQED